jgi:DNA adenine methylase
MSALIDPVDEFGHYVMRAKPVLKWAGGKAQLEEPILKAIDRLHPKVIKHYYEPFAGGLAIFFALRRRFKIRRATLSDTNAELINFYLQIQNEPEALIGALRKLKKQGFSEKRYYEVRASKPRSDAARAARFKYINACGFNGLWRVNKQNICNVPYGHRKTPPEICDEEALWAAHHAFEVAEIVRADYQAICSEIRENKKQRFVYLDPPYWPTRPTANFTSYTEADFGERDQKNLEGEFHFLATFGISALLSNSDVPATRALYSDYKKQKLQACRNINSDAAKRGAVSELLVESTFRK